MLTPDNVIGGALDDGIIKQLEKRIDILGQTGQRTHTDLLYLGNKNCWIKMTSFTDIVADADKIAAAMGGEVKFGGRDDLARQWTLSGGVSTAGDGVNKPVTMRSGIGTKDDPYSGAYGAGGIGELGYRPMPGIESLTVESIPPLGATYQATVKIKAWNLNQLSILDMLYFRLGFSSLIEWGHSTYVDNGGHVKTTIVQTIDAFKKGITSDDIKDEIQKKRVESGYNYDAMLGFISNYEWVQSRDGSYDCTVRVTGLGSLAESLKINNQENMPAVTQPSQGGTATNQTTPLIIDSALKGFLTEVKNFANANAYSTTPNLAGFEAKMKEVFSTGKDYLNLIDSSKKPGDIYDNFKHGFSRRYMRDRSKGMVASQVPPLKLADFVKYTTLSVQTTTKTSSPTSTTVLTYIPLSLLLAYINNSCLIYTGDSDRKHIVSLDFHPDTNICLHVPQQVSIDPTVCLVDCYATTQELQDLLIKKGITDLSRITSPGPLTADCTVNQKINATGLSFIDKSSPYRGHTMNIFVNVDYLLRTYDAVMSNDPKKNIILNVYLKQILTDISKAIGGINIFSIIPDQTTDVITIFDTQNLASDKEAIPEIPVFGLGTATVREYSLKTDASTALGSTLAITAQYDPSRDDLNKSGLNRDGSGFVAINKRLQDRLKLHPSTSAVSTAAQNSPTASNSNTPTTPSSIVPFNANIVTTATQQIPFNPAVGIPALTIPGATTQFNANVVTTVGQQVPFTPAVSIPTITVTAPPTPQQAAAYQAEQQNYVQANAFNKQLTYTYGFSNTPLNANGHPESIQLNQDNIPGVLNYYTDALLKVKNSNDVVKGTITANGILPLSLNMTLDGISGIPLFEAFTLPGNRLPIQYCSTKGVHAKPLVGFTIVGVSHTIQNNQWTTSIKGQMINLPEGTPIKKLSQPQPRTYIPGVRPDSGYKNTALYKDAAFQTRLQQLCTKWKINADDLLRIFYAECRLNPADKLYTDSGGNSFSRPGPGRHLLAVGLIQWTPDNVKRGGTPGPAYTLEQISTMSGVEQLGLVDMYFTYWKRAGKDVTQGNILALYSIVFIPALFKPFQSGNPTDIVKYGRTSPERISKQNPAIARAAGKKPGEPLTIQDFRRYVDTV
jgi:hypothetical protein